MAEEELKEAMREPYEDDPDAAEEDTLESELAWKLNVLLKSSRITYGYSV